MLTMEPSYLLAGTPAAVALLSFARDVLDEAQRALELPENTDAVAVHDFRKAMKRWRALLRLLEPIVGTETGTVRLKARDLARELAPARDRQAALDALSDVMRLRGDHRRGRSRPCVGGCRGGKKRRDAPH
jgi:CHAD domain-containing protein